MLTCCRQRCSATSSQGRFDDILVTDFRPKKALLVRKVTRYEYEKLYLKPDFNEEQLKEYVVAKGSDYEALRQRHDEYFKSVDEIQSELVKRGIEYRMIHRYDFDKSYIDWADVIFTAGGDGTFLMVASNIGGRSKPIIGINTDPLRSEGFLCLPKHYSREIGTAFDRIFGGDFRWLWRQRIRLTAYGLHASDVPVDLHNQQMLYPEHRFWEHVHESELTKHSNDTINEWKPRVLPVLALNEVFIGESLSSRVSFYELLVDGGTWQKQKSSGITVCPGTGSTSWHFNINHISLQTARDILRIAQKHRGCSNANLQDDTLLQQVVNEFNSALVFCPSETKMAYTIRDPLSSGIFQVSEPRGFCSRLQVKSRMWDACIVVDGSLSFTFNDGALVELEVHCEDALRCVHLD
jgi:NAD+ kinase